MTNATVMEKKTVTRGQVRKYLLDAGKDPDAPDLKKIIESMEDEVEEEEWDDLAKQFRDEGAEVNLDKASQLTPGITVPGVTQPGPTVPGPTKPDVTLMGMGAVSATDPDDAVPPVLATGGTDDDEEEEEFSGLPAIDEVNELAPGGPAPDLTPPDVTAPTDDEGERVTIPRHPPANFGTPVTVDEQPPTIREGRSSHPAPPHPQPRPPQPQRKEKSGLGIGFLGGLAGVVIVGALVVAWMSQREDSSETNSTPKVVQTTPDPTTPNPQPTQAPTPTLPAAITATCDVKRYSVDNCTFSSSCSRVNTGSQYLQAMCGAVRYQSQVRENVLSLGKQQIQLIKSQ